ncbi:BamA/TamA family outer membrane protein [Olivibacter sitiensis]|uniref:BamA/TamA family outer membrane protein n=1 Tax=Olivibacter sitiensis TaxID=376470 RepID=UPI000404071C|nr:BamA/TamA family outer membrane protein [Olivibacter sitiensis]
MKQCRPIWFYVTLLFIGIFSCPAILLAQTAIKHRAIFIGPTGGDTALQEKIISKVEDMLIAKSSTVFYLGSQKVTEKKQGYQALSRLFKPFENKETSVFMLSGERDWGNQPSWHELQTLEDYLKANADSTWVHLIPKNGCPDPQLFQLDSNLVALSFDSNWLIQPTDMNNDDDDCDCDTKQDVLDKIEELLYLNRKKTILLVTHHPVASYGHRGGYYTWKDHLFPLTNLNKNLYIPLPIIGSLYPLGRSTLFSSEQDLRQPQYSRWIDAMEDIMDQQHNIYLFSSHEKGQQLIQTEDGNIQSITGANKSANLLRGKRAVYSSGRPGFVVYDYLEDQSTRITFYSFLSKENEFVKSYAYHNPYTPDTIQDTIQNLYADVDSVLTVANEAYDKVGKTHRKLFGENYRKEWAQATTVPIIRASQFAGGLSPIKRGGGMQTKSLRLEDKTGKQWVMRSVNKSTDALLPDELLHTFAQNFLDDANSAQHPYAALMVPPLADAVEVPHTNPIIGIVAPDPALGGYNAVFSNMLCLVEEREPLGKSDNTVKMLKKLHNDNDDVYKAKNFLRARMLDLLIGDWDRHEDQWRWKDTNEKGDKDYLGVPRDRDQAFRMTDGFFPKIVSQPWILPTMQAFDSQIKSPKYSLIKSDFLNAHYKSQFSHQEWMDLAREFVSDMTDSVLHESVMRLPKAIYELRYEELFQKLKERRDNIPQAMDNYYRFIHEIVDIRLSNKHELVHITDGDSGSVKLVVRKINKADEVKRKLMDATYSPTLTKEIRIYLSNGDDSVFVDIKHSPIKIRIVGGTGNKQFQVENANKPIRVYDKPNTTSYIGRTEKLKIRSSSDTLNTRYVETNLYNVWYPLATLGYNADDGLLIGGGFRYSQQKGFRKIPFTHTQQLTVAGSLRNGAFRINYLGHWKDAIGRADFLLKASALAPNTQNFFGLGSASEYNKDFPMSYYRARFHLYDLTPSFLWEMRDKTSLTLGPTLQYYHFSPSQNAGRLITQPQALYTYDSLTVSKNKAFAGLVADFVKDKRDNTLIPTSGGYIHTNVSAYTGLNAYSKSYVKISADLALFVPILRNSITFANRIGGAAILGKETFYQSLFLGGHGNLWGYRQFRFAGEQLFYNNAEARMRLADIGSYLLPGQLGITAFYDVGKVWSSDRDDEKMKHALGGGLYYAPAKIAVIQVVAGRSQEGWYPYLTMGFRF